MARDYIKWELHVVGGCIGFSIGIAFLETNPGKSFLAEKENQIREYSSESRSGLLNLQTLASLHSLSYS